MATVERPSKQVSQETPSLSLQEIDFRYDPFPIGFAEKVLSARFYQQLLECWPPEQLFLHKPQNGNKYSLSPVNNSAQYQAFLAATPAWMHFYKMISSQAFIAYVLECLRNHNVDLGLLPGHLSSRFEFSMMGGEGGYILPHTDAPQKVITLVIYMVGPGEWDSTYGGGTSALRPKDIRKNYNRLNIYLEFDQVECLHTYPFVPNGCVVFIKTFNSYHAVYPIQGRADLPRRSLTINIERNDDVALEYVKKHRPAFRI